MNDSLPPGPEGCGPVCASRRTALALGAVSGAALLTGCATYGGSSGSAAPVAEASGGGQEAAAGPTDSAGSGGSTDEGRAEAGGGEPALTSTEAIPVGGGKIFAAKKVVVTQPSAGTFKAFSTVCPHQGCDVNEVEGGTINCPCHGSKFAIADGAVTAGPSRTGLPAVKITVDGDAVTLA